METFAFFFEAIFLGIYLYTWERFRKPITHFLLVIPIVIGSSASAFFITSVNAFMNTPQGFKLQNGAIVDVQPLIAMFNPATPTKVAHVLVSSYMTSSFVLASIAAAALLKNRHSLYHLKALKLTMTAALVFSVMTTLVGDLSGKFLAKYQPEKLAAAEWHFETAKHAPLVLGGVLTKDHRIKYGLTIPYGLSILAYDNPNAVVQGLNDTPVDERPPLVVHYIFEAMVGIGIFLTLLAILYVWLIRKRKLRQNPRWLLAWIVLSGPLALLAIETGWFYAEVGRQPWILRGYMKTAQGATLSTHVDTMLILFCFLYLVLGLTTIKILSGMFANNDLQEELEDRGIEGGPKR